MEPFYFKHFAVRHQQSAMRLNTDGVLLGAWAQVPEEVPQPRILDVGTGCGIIALMLAQRYPKSHIVAIDVDPPSVSEAQENVRNSLWADRIQVQQADFKNFTDDPFDLIVSNPPFFSDSLLSPSNRRSAARHCTKDSLTHHQLIQAGMQLLSPKGQIALILPAAGAPELFRQYDGILFQNRVTYVQTRKAGGVERMLVSLSFKASGPAIETSLRVSSGLQDADPQYLRLIENFYLWA